MINLDHRREGHALAVTRFSLPETHAAFGEWSRLTGYGWDSPEWGEVLASLESCDLLAADRLPQRGLFDPPDLQLGDAPLVRRLRAVIVASARLHDGGWGHDLATSAQIVAAVLDRFYTDSDTYPLAPLVERLTGELPRRVRGLAASPSEALEGLLAVDAMACLSRRPYSCDSPSLAAVVLAEAEANDRFAECIFQRLALNPGWELALLTLGDGRSLLYHVG